MNQLIIEGEIVEQLRRLSGPAELCDSSGRILGEFHPRTQASSKLPEGFESPFSKEELDAARRDPRRYTTDEVLKHLKSL